MIYRILFVFIAAIVTKPVLAQQDLNASNTYVLICGVLKWPDSTGLASFESKNRQDIALKNELIEDGIPEQNIITILDEKVTKSSIHKSLMALSEKCNTTSTLLFYYAGHGVKKNGSIYFANYDISLKNCKETGFNINDLSVFAENCNASTFIYLADCCYSGGLIDVAKKTEALGKTAIALTSATASNTSTGNWTYTLTLIDCLKGNEFVNKNNDDKITLDEISIQVEQNMKCYERQLSGFYSNLKTGFSISKATSKPITLKNSQLKFAPGQAAFAFLNGKWQPVRIQAVNNQSEFTTRFINYSNFSDQTCKTKALKNAFYVKHAIQSKVNVEWEGKPYKAVILDSKNDFYYVKYEGYGDEWNEWVMYDRISTGKEKKAEIEYQGKWYKGLVLTEGDKKYFVRYEGFDYTWDEWVGPERIKIKGN